MLEGRKSLNQAKMKRNQIMRYIIAISIFCLASLPCWGFASNGGTQVSGDLFELDITELMDIEITSVSKRPEKLSEASAAIFVITQEDIRRSGASSIPEALRMAPGLHVARMNTFDWAITSRGFNGRFANKLLVLIDGRSIYNPVFSGVYWGARDTMIEDIERIEVIRGPGAALWGANAVNGVINIITKSVEDTQSGLITAGGGTEEKAFGAIRYGGKMGEKVRYRGYTKYFNRDDFTLESGGNPDGEWESYQGGFRIDADATEADSLTLQGDSYRIDDGHIKYNNIRTSPYIEYGHTDVDYTGRNVLGRWKHRFSDTSETALQLYYDREKVSSYFLETFREKVDTYDIDLMHHFKLGTRQDFSWGLGFRYVSSKIDNVASGSFDRSRRDTLLYSTFVHDEITIVEDKLKIILGSKFEQNDYTGFEIQPNGRILWTPHERHTVWGAISRAVRTPNRTDHDATSLLFEPVSTTYPAVLVEVVGDDEFNSEELMAYEIGYRVQPLDNLSLDVVSFYNDYDKLATYEQGELYLGGVSPDFYYVVPFTVDNKMAGETYGVELSAQWKALDWWRLYVTYSYIQMKLHLDDDSTNSEGKAYEGRVPEHQYTVRSTMDLPKDFELDAFLRSVDDLRADNIKSYTEMNLRIGWAPKENLEFSIMGTNLLNNTHAEYIGGNLGAPTIKIERGVYAKITWRF